MMLFSFSYTPLFLLSDCLSVSPSFTHLPFIGFGPRGCEAWLSTGAELSKLQQRCKGRGAGGKKRAKKLKEGCAFVWVCACVCVFVGRVQLSHFSLLGNMKPDKQRNYAASYCRESYTGRDKNRGWRHRGADRKWKQDWGEPKGQGVDCWGVWICMTGRCERMEVWVDGSCVWSKSARLPYWTGLYSADIWFSTLNFKDLMHFNEIWLKAHYLNGIADIKQFASHSDSHHRPITNCQVSSDSKDRT